MYLLREKDKERGEHSASHRSARATYKPRGWISTIRSLTLSPMSFIHALTLLRSLSSGQLACCSVVESSLLMYTLSRSLSNLGRGEDASERGGGGDRSLEGLAIAFVSLIPQLFPKTASRVQFGNHVRSHVFLQ